MSNFGSTIYDAGPTQGTPVLGKPTRPRPNQEYIASGPGRLAPEIPQALPKDFDDVTRNFGGHPYEAMLTDPAVYSSYLALKLSILAGEIQVQPKLKPKGYRYTPPSIRKQKPAKPGKVLSGDDAKPEAETEAEPVDPKIQLAQEVAEFLERELERLETPIKSTMLQMFDCMAQGSKLAEVTRQVCESGPDKGRLVLKSVKVKPEWAWQYVVDAFMNVVGIITYVPPGTIQGDDDASRAGGFLILPPEKFAILTWLPKDNDPRGTSALRAAYDFWNLKQQVKPYYYAHLRRFGSPSLDGELAEGDTSASPAIDPETGQEMPGRFESPGQRYFSQLTAFQNNTVIVRPAGSKLNILEPKSNGEAFLSGFDLFDRQICLAIGLQVRASLEAKNGSKADSETAENTRGLIVDYGRDLASQWLRIQLLWDSVALNFGQEVADELMPEILIGDTEAQDFAANLTAAASAGYTIGESQLPDLDNKLNMPERDIEADKAAAQMAAQQQAELMAKHAPPGSDEEKPSKKGEPPKSGGKPKPEPTQKPSKGAKR